MLSNLTYELSTLSKAVQHKNLSAASAHVGLSQPQLSRMISKIESELNIVLLDRSARRKSGWTPLAQELAIAFNRGMGRMQSEILALAQEREVTELRIGTLEGLSHIALQFVQDCFKKLKMHQIYLDVLEYQDLDARFLSQDLDLIFTARTPSLQKFSNMIEVGYQGMQKIGTDSKTLVCSPFEFSGYDRKFVESADHVMVCNSLALRSHWLQNIGGTGTLPVDAKKGRGKGHYSVLLIGSDLLSPALWNRIEEIFE